jgi:diguanylate cyclase (GGDEF)-like protein
MPRGALLMNGRWAAAGGRAVSAGFVVVAALLAAAHIAGSPGILLLAGVLPIIAIFVSFRVNEITDRLPWLLVALGMALLTVVNGRWFIVTEFLGEASADSVLTRVFQAAGYAALLSASIVVVLRHTPQNGGAIIDAALVGMGAAGIVWATLLRPRLLEMGASSTNQVLMLVQSSILLACAGALLRISWTTRRARAALNYLFVSLGSTILGLILSVTLAGADGSRRHVLIVLCWLVGYLAQAAAALHPSAAAFTQPSGGRTEELSPYRLALLGAVLLVPGIAGSAPHFVGGEPDILLLGVGPLMIVPLVLTRIGQLIAQRARDQQALAHQANHDELTGLANRRSLLRQVDSGFERIALLYGDLDGFKPINDRHGHEAGDFVLQEVARRLSATVRRDDVVGRLGGDEFLVLCPAVAPAEAEALRDRIEEAVCAPMRWRGENLTVGITIGLMHADAAAGLTPDELFAAADEQMYLRKRRKKMGADERADHESWIGRSLSTGPAVASDEQPGLPLASGATTIMEPAMCDPEDRLQRRS